MEQEQKKSKRTKYALWGCLGSCLGVLGCFGVLFLGVALIVSSVTKLVSSPESDFDTCENYIAIIPMQGVITLRTDSALFSNSSNVISAEDICEQLEDAIYDDSVKAVVLRINSPGGEVVASDMIYQKVLEVRESGKPVVCAMEVTTASGGYYIAAGCDYIFAHKFTTTGSIGVIISSLKYYDLYDLIGLDEEYFASGDNKTMLSGAKPTTPEAKDIAQNMVDTIYQGFAKVVSDGRNIPLENIVDGKIGDGRVFLGEEAVELGLVDELGNINNAIEYAAELANIIDYETFEYNSSSEFETFMNDFFSRTNPSGEIKIELPESDAERLMRNSNSKVFYLLK